MSLNDNVTSVVHAKPYVYFRTEFFVTCPCIYKSYLLLLSYLSNDNFILFYLQLLLVLNINYETILGINIRLINIL